MLNHDREHPSLSRRRPGVRSPMEYLSIGLATSQKPGRSYIVRNQKASTGGSLLQPQEVLVAPIELVPVGVGAGHRVGRRLPVVAPQTAAAQGGPSGAPRWRAAPATARDLLFVPVGSDQGGHRYRAPSPTRAVPGRAGHGPGIMLSRTR